MNCNHYRKIVHAAMWFGGKIALSKRLKDGYHKGYYSDAGGKLELNETLLNAVRRETYEETGFLLDGNDFELIDCFIYPKRKLKTFLFEVFFYANQFDCIENKEPNKQSNWKLFTIEEALKLKSLMPSVRYYLNNIKKQKLISPC